MADDPLDVLDDGQREHLRKASMPKWTAPMLATLTDDRFSRPDWIFERKLDGVRCLAFRANDRVRLLSRNRREMNDTWPELADAIGSGPDLIVDGEIVAFDGAVTSFSRLQGRIGIRDPEEARRSGIAVHYYVFDVLHCGGWDVTKVPLRARKSVLKRVLSFDRRIRFTAHRNESGEAYYEQACRKGWEGVIAKRAASPYVHHRSHDWLKFKCVHRQELVIGGWTDPQGARVGFGALLVGYYDDGALRYAGKVGTGYDDDTLQSLGARLERLERKSPPFADGDAIREKHAHWATPKLVGEVGFTEWTDDGKLRHPRFLGLRADKDAEDVVRERPE